MSLVRGEKGMQETKVEAKTPKSKSSRGTIRSLRKKSLASDNVNIFCDF